MTENKDALREVLDLDSAFLPAARVAADAAMAQTADEFDINASADAQRWMDARNGAWFALSTPQPQTVDDTRAALAEAIEALKPFAAAVHDWEGGWIGIYEEHVSRAAQVVAKHGDGRS